MSISISFHREQKIFILLLMSIFIFSFLGEAAAKKNEVVVYTALDQPYSEPVLKRFEEKTGIRVRAVYDVEATKTIGLVNRIIAEKNNPRCDVFWNNEVVNTIRLQNRGLLVSYKSPAAVMPAENRDPQHYWHGFAARARVIVYNTFLLSGEKLPGSIEDLLATEWQHKGAMALPLFGTTATQAAALFQLWGEEKAMAFFQGIKKNGQGIVDGNSVVRDRVADGTYLWGVTDTDDAFSGMKRGMPIEMILPDQDSIGTLLIPNTVALIKGGPNPDMGRRFIDFLLSEEVELMLAHSGSGQIPLRPGLKPAEGIPEIDEIVQSRVDYVQLAPLMEKVLPKLEKIF